MRAAVFLNLISILLLATAALLSLAQAQAQDDISDQCIGCICYGGNGCKKDAGCHDGVCGPLLITWGYWADAGKPVIRGMNPEDPQAYPTCAQDLYCAAEAVRGYMAKFKRDCNGDGFIDCDDYARIHQKGPGSCSDPSVTQTPFYKEFSRCNQHLRP